MDCRCLQRRIRSDGGGVAHVEAVARRRADVHAVEEREVLGELVELLGEERVLREAELRALGAEAAEGLAEQHGCVSRAKGQRSEHIRAARTLYEPRG